MKVKANQQAKTFTIRVNGNKYRTFKFDKITFEDCEHNTELDWSIFLHYSNSYYLVK